MLAYLYLSWKIYLDWPIIWWGSSPVVCTRFSLCPIFTGLAFLCSNVYLPCPCPFLGLAAARRLCGRHRGPAPPLPREREAATDRRAKVEAGQSAYNGDEIAKLQHVRFQVEQDKLFIQRNLARLRNTFVELVKR